jgi:uncharacterized protein with HEPN domain
MSKLAVEYFKHIREECQFINSVITDELTKAEMLDNEVLKRALVRSLEIIGEASKKVPANVKLKYPQVSWKNMAGMRDKLIHDYMGIDYGIVWDVVKRKIPEITVHIELAIENEQG